MVKENRQVSPFFTFYLIHTAQIGVAILGFERYIAKDAGHDAWISILISGFSINLIIWMSYKILNKGKSDITVIHKQLFGKVIGNFFSLVFIVYLLALMVTISRTYVEVIQIWIFPQLHTWYMIMILLTITYVFVIKGFRVVTGIAFLSVLYGIPVIFMNWFPLQEGHITRIFPIMDHSVGEILLGAKTMTLNFLGFETLFFFYPFIKQAEKSQKWSHLGVLFSIFLYFLTAVVSFLYFSQSQLKDTIWATLTLWKIVNLPFIERFEYTGIVVWLFVIIPNLCLLMWSASWGLKKVIHLKQKKGLILLLIITFISCVLFSNRVEIDLLNTYTGKAGFILIYFYIPFLYAFQLIRLKAGKKNE
ncbi:spore germination protein (amino acid permease) [Bacillus sp. OV322]|uniref:GerAB/ArcD/ProY family transporter n=1 Tax=Bacillus sp. OV322 TaxID=1882764 RepID=UPI0008F29E96|nr:GerAB/ArcD/ProY family transporter [Bacillus sp. OV322]SFC35749.1 spore germination protein (amino acid permease) [Bacillus sp. OV322]